jgi:isoamylase
MTDEEWRQSHAQCLGMLLSGEALEERGERGESIKDSNFLLIINAGNEGVPFTLPALSERGRWRPLVDTTWTDTSRRSVHDAGASYSLGSRALALLIEHRGGDRRGEA